MATSAASPTNPQRRRGLALTEGLTAASAIAGAVGLANRSIDLGATITRRLPFESPVFGGVALVVVVALPMAAGSLLSWRGGRRANPVAVGAGVALMGWIVVELAFIRSISWLHPTLFLVGAAIAFAGYRGWHLTWGAAPNEVAVHLPGDANTPSGFHATRAISIDAPPSAVWPWLTQVGLGRAGFYSYDSLDNRGRRSADHVLAQFQQVHVGDVAAPMASRPSANTSFFVASVDPERSLVWAKSDAVWAWELVPVGEGTRLVVRLRTGADWHHPLRSLSGVALMEVGDFPLMHKMLIGIRQRAESLARATEGEHYAA
jgi:hypothetical protein